MVTWLCGSFDDMPCLHPRNCRDECQRLAAPPASVPTPSLPLPGSLPTRKEEYTMPDPNLTSLYAAIYEGQVVGEGATPTQAIVGALENKNIELADIRQGNVEIFKREGRAGFQVEVGA